MSPSTRGIGIAVAMILLLAACVAVETPSPSAPQTPTPNATDAPTAVPTASASPTASPEPPLSLDLPEVSDPRVVAASVDVQIGSDGGTLIVTVTSTATERIDELVLRWSTELDEALFLAPFTPSDDRIRDGGPPLVQPWTKWVIGPGERGEPDGTTSVGWGPLLPDATLVIQLDASRRVPDPVAFDLQLLSGNDLLTFEGGGPAEIRVEIP